jgi:hypothetical protein
MKRTLTLAALLIGGCTPRDAEVDGNWFVWLAANTSGTVAGDRLPTLTDDSTVFECSGRGWDSEAGTWDEGYIGPRIEADYSDDRFIGGACARTDGGSYQNFCADLVDEMTAECDGVSALDFHLWQQEDGFYGLSGGITGWRTEGLLNSEGDLQLTVHNDLGHGEDFRFHFSIAPDFAPADCIEDDEGNPSLQHVDGADWVEQWSADEEGHRIWYINAGSYQVNPNDSDIYWYLPNEWNSGYGYAKWSAEEFNSHPGDYGNYNEDFDHFVAISNREDPSMDEYAASVEALTTQGETWAAELHDTAQASVGGTPAFTHKIESNDWRPIDIHSHGLDGWMELHSSWVRIKDSSEIVEGGTVEGDYQIYYDGSESSSRLLVNGTFKIENLRVDPWGYPAFEEQKREENGTAYCGGDTL